ncbi:MAG TPA: GNAT family N-acetyltransferase [Frateuria sp.]|uniref:GNAT family N-acetyltransferase n=1 Tax=Frateuria sp. TaxID=2211372 RepID=UPI002D7FEA7C|nr:GNAT family N-acetyltransferase [Frateuria sp.]HET6805186.1 GNAT family N-acetyltransferase [Frateuria sp.]
MTQADAGEPGAIRGLRSRWVFGAITASLRRQLLAFWMRERALDNPDEAWRRSWEVACLLEEPATGDIAGVCTVAIALDDQHRCYGFLRIFIAPRERRPGLGRRMLRTVIEGFEALAREPGAPLRLVATIENRKIEGRGVQRVLAHLGFECTGRTPRGELLIQRPLGTRALRPERCGEPALEEAPGVTTRG